MSENLKDQKSVTERRAWVEKEKNITLSNIGMYSLNEGQASSKNCENMIGVTQVPLGVAGPLTVVDDKKTHKYFIPLATTEGALVASINRGCKAISLSGGAHVYGENKGVTRGPVFKTQSLEESIKLKKWVEKNSMSLSDIANNSSRYLEVKKIQTKIVGRYVYLRVSCDTQKAMGMNMVTIATTQMCSYIEKETNTECVSVAGNFDVDKKPAWLNMIEGRGKSIWAEAVVTKDVVKNVLKTTPEAIYNVWLAKNMIGSAVSGSMGFNAHFANSIGAIYLATGQDVAHVVEGSMGISSTEVDRNGNLEISIYMPAILTGTVGGGTALETQKEALSIIAIPKNLDENMTFAKIIGATTLAGELSLLAALSEGSLAQAHIKHARGKKA